LCVIFLSIPHEMFRKNPETVENSFFFCAKGTKKMLDQGVVFVQNVK
jgi:hypothetical protein